MLTPDVSQCNVQSSVITHPDVFAPGDNIPTKDMDALSSVSQSVISILGTTRKFHQVSLDIHDRTTWPRPRQATESAQRLYSILVEIVKNGNLVNHSERIFFVASVKSTGLLVILSALEELTSGQKAAADGGRTRQY